MIHTSEDLYPPRQAEPAGSPAERALRRFSTAGPFFQPLGTLAGVEAFAEINHSRWIVRCPWCTSASATSPEDPRFMCVDCHNDHQASWLRVVFPDNRLDLEEALAARRRPERRNWQPGEAFIPGQGWVGRAESLDDLRAENAAAHPAELGGAA